VTLLGIGGVALSGKDATAAVLEQEGWQRTYMSRALEQAMLALDPFIVEDRRFARRYSEIHAARGYDESKKVPEVRRFLQALGTAVGRDMLDRNYWVDAAFRQIDTWMTAGDDVVLTGVRYPNELDARLRRGGTSVWVDRGLPPLNSHSSENTLTADDFDLVLPNLGTLDDLSRTVGRMLLHA
jgi:hypothetical protein